MRLWYCCLLLGWVNVGWLSAQPIPANVSATQQPANVLRYDVQFTTPQAARGFVEYVYWNGTDSIRIHTSASDSGMSHAITVLGLVPQEVYHYRAWSYDATGCYASPWDSFTVAAVPPSVTVGHVLNITGTAGFPLGYVLSNTAIGDPDRYLQIHDRRGNLIWYERMPGVAAASADGPCQHFSYLPSTRSILVTRCGEVAEIGLDGTVFRTANLGAAAPGWMAHHDAVRLANGNWLVLAARPDTMDLSSVGGDPNAIVVGPGILEFDPSGALQWSWSAFDHLDPLTSPAPGGDWVPKIGPQAINWLDANALMQDGDGNPMLSLGGSSQILKIARNSGAVVWTVGPSGSIEILPPDTFMHQHALRPSRPGYYLSLDNAGLDTMTRATEWWIDFSYINPRMKISWEHVLPIADYTADDGNVDKLPSGTLLIGSAGGRSITEITTVGSLLWRAQLDSSLYRAYWVEDLYGRLRPHFTGDTVVCLSDSAIILQASPTGGIWSGDFVQGNVFDAAAAGVGLHVVTYKLGPEEFSVELQVDGSVNCGVAVADAQLRTLMMAVFPNPWTQGDLHVQFALATAERMRLEVHALDGRLLAQRDLGRLSGGEHGLRLTPAELGLRSGAVLVTLHAASGKVGRQIVVIE